MWCNCVQFSMCVTRIRSQIHQVVYYRHISTLKIPYLLSIFRVIRVPTIIRYTVAATGSASVCGKQITHILPSLSHIQYCTPLRVLLYCCTCSSFFFFVNPPRQKFARQTAANRRDKPQNRFDQLRRVIYAYILNNTFPSLHLPILSETKNANRCFNDNTFILFYFFFVPHPSIALFENIRVLGR